jgi:hypothetical protein
MCSSGNAQRKRKRKRERGGGETNIKMLRFIIGSSLLQAKEFHIT